jgi:YbgC/YbaW family acyl-CoA thioester hydrolase
MPITFRTTRIVEFGDTDMAGIVHFANFFRFMEAAEHAFLRSRGLSVAMNLDGQQVGIPRVSASCDYLRPARFGDELTIVVTLEKVGRSSLAYGFDVLKGDEEVARGQITAVFCRKNEEGRWESCAIPPAFRAKLEGERPERSSD